jgi:hypothetical protein
MNNKYKNKIKQKSSNLTIKCDLMKKSSDLLRRHGTSSTGRIPDYHDSCRGCCSTSSATLTSSQVVLCGVAAAIVVDEVAALDVPKVFKMRVSNRVNGVLWRAGINLWIAWLVCPTDSKSNTQEIVARQRGSRNGSNTLSTTGMQKLGQSIVNGELKGLVERPSTRRCVLWLLSSLSSSCAPMLHVETLPYRQILLVVDILLNFSPFYKTHHSAC